MQTIIRGNNIETPVKPCFNDLSAVNYILAHRSQSLVSFTRPRILNRSGY